MRLRAAYERLSGYMGAHGSPAALIIDEGATAPRRRVQAAAVDEGAPEQGGSDAEPAPREQGSEDLERPNAELRDVDALLDEHGARDAATRVADDLHRATRAAEAPACPPQQVLRLLLRLHARGNVKSARLLMKRFQAWLDAVGAGPRVLGSGGAATW